MRTRRNVTAATAAPIESSSEPTKANNVTSKRTRSTAKSASVTKSKPAVATKSRSKRTVTKVDNGGDAQLEPSSNDITVSEQPITKPKRGAAKPSKVSIIEETTKSDAKSKRSKKNALKESTTTNKQQTTEATSSVSTRSTRSKNVKSVEAVLLQTKLEPKAKASTKKKASPKAKSSPKKKVTKAAKKSTIKNEEQSVPDTVDKKSVIDSQSTSAKASRSKQQKPKSENVPPVQQESSETEQPAPKRATRTARAVKKVEPVEKPTVSDRAARAQKRDIPSVVDNEGENQKKPRMTKSKESKASVTLVDKPKRAPKKAAKIIDEQTAQTTAVSNSESSQSDDKSIEQDVTKSISDKPTVDKVKTIPVKKARPTKKAAQIEQSVDSSKLEADCPSKTKVREPTVVRTVRFEDEVDNKKTTEKNVESEAEVDLVDKSESSEKSEKIPDDEGFEVIDYDELYKIKAHDVLDSVVSEVERSFENTLDPDKTELVVVDERLYANVEQNDNAQSRQITNQNGGSVSEISRMASDTSLKRKLDISMDEVEKPLEKRIRVEQLVGELFTFGDQIVGETGTRDVYYNNQKVKMNQPARVKLPCKIQQVACGAFHTIVVCEDKSLISFGCNDDASLGRITSKPTSTGNGNHTNDNSDDDDELDPAEYEELMCFKPLAVSGISSNVIKVTAGDMHSAALTDDGKVYLWGNLKDESNKLGLFVDDMDLSSNDGKPTRVPRQVILDNKAVDIASGCHHILILTENGQVYSLGEGSKGQLGRIPAGELNTIKSNRDLFLNAQLVKFSSQVIIKRVFASHWCSYALTEDGSLYGWGLNNYFQLGFRTDPPVEVTVDENVMSLLIELSPVRVPTDFKVASVSNGQQHLVVLDIDGQVYTCGSAIYGKLGIGKDFMDKGITELSSLSKIDQKLFGNDRVSFVECSDFCSMAITESGKLYTWGQGSLHIGTNTERDLFEPTPIGGAYAADAKFFSMSSGAHYLALVGVLSN